MNLSIEECKILLKSSLIAMSVDMDLKNNPMSKAMEKILEHVEKLEAENIELKSKLNTKKIMNDMPGG
jgi:hypothetical protein